MPGQECIYKHSAPQKSKFPRVDSREISWLKTHFGRKMKHKAEVKQDVENCLGANILEVKLAGNAGLQSGTQRFALTASTELLMLDILLF